MNNGLGDLMTREEMIKKLHEYNNLYAMSCDRELIDLDRNKAKYAVRNKWRDLLALANEFARLTA